jgi:hypothetical protein
MRTVSYTGPGMLELDEDAMPGWQVPLSGGLVGTVVEGGVVEPVRVIGEPHPPVRRAAEMALSMVWVGRGFIWDGAVGVRISDDTVVWGGGVYGLMEFGLVSSCMIRVPNGTGAGWVLADGVWCCDPSGECMAPSCELEGVIYG